MTLTFTKGGPALANPGAYALDNSRR